MLFVGAGQGYLDVGQFSRQAGADKDEQRQDGSTPLFVASQEGHLDVVRFLCHSEADKEKSDAGGASPPFVSAVEGHYDEARLCAMLWLARTMRRRMA